MNLGDGSAQWADYPGTLLGRVKLTCPVYKVVVESNAWMVRCQALIVMITYPCMPDDPCLGSLRLY